MKKIIPVILFFLAILIAPAFYFAKGKSPVKPVGDTAIRHFKTKAIKKPKVVMLTSDSLQYTVTSKGDGPIPEIGDKITVIYTGRLTNDTIFDASSKHGFVPLAFHVGKREVIAGWDSVFSHLHGGDKAIVRIPAKYGYGANPRGLIPANATLIFEVEILSITPKIKQWSCAGKDTVTMPSGLKIVYFETHPENPLPKKGQTVVVDYSGFLLDGSSFDSSVERGQPYEFPIGQNRVIKGWDEGIALLHKGEKAQLIIPYQLAYGANGRPPQIPAKATLIFDVHLINIK